MKTTLLGLLLVLTACGGSSNLGGNNNQPPVDLSGSWEIAATSTGVTTGPSLLIETNLTSTGSSNGSNIVLITAHPFGTAFDMGGQCSGSGVNTITLSGTQPTVTFTLDEGGNTFSGQATVGAATITGAYASPAGASCADSGTFTATRTTPVVAHFAGFLDFPSGHHDSVSLQEAVSVGQIQITVTLTGGDTGNLTLSGTYVGNTIQANGNQTLGGVTSARVLVFYYSPANHAMYVYEPDGTFDGQLNQQ